MMLGSIISRDHQVFIEILFGGLLRHWMSRNEFDSIFNRMNVICLGIRDLNAELLLNSHDNLDRIQRIQVQILLESCSRRYLGLVYLMMSKICQDQSWNLIHPAIPSQSS